MNYDDFTKYIKVKLNNKNIENIVGEMKRDYYNLMNEGSDKAEMIELKLKDIKTDIDKISLISIFFTLIVHLVPALFKLLYKDFATELWIRFLIILYIIMGRYFVKIVDVYRIVDLYLNVIYGIKNNNKDKDEIEIIESDKEFKEYIIKIKEIN